MQSSEFRAVYDRGWKHSCPYFAAFCLDTGGADGPRAGFTTPRALGKAVVRNRIKRRMREAVRLRLDRVGAQWWIVFNPRSRARTAPFPDLLAEVEKLFLRCSA